MKVAEHVASLSAMQIAPPDVLPAGESETDKKLRQKQRLLRRLHKRRDSFGSIPSESLSHYDPEQDVLLLLYFG